MQNNTPENFINYYDQTVGAKGRTLLLLNRRGYSYLSITEWITCYNWISCDILVVNISLISWLSCQVKLSNFNLVTTIGSLLFLVFIWGDHRYWLRSLFVVTTKWGKRDLYESKMMNWILFLKKKSVKRIKTVSQKDKNQFYK